MSMIVRKKGQVRNTPFLNFLLVASLPLLVSFLGGMAISSASDLNQQSRKSTLKDCESLLLKKNEDVNNLIKIADSLMVLKEIYTQNIRELQQNLTLLSPDDISRINQWQYTQKDVTINRWEGKFSLFRQTSTEILDQNYLRMVDFIFGLFEEIRLLNALTFDNSLEKLKENARKENIPIQTPTDPCAQEKIQLIQLNQQISDLKSDLRGCQGNQVADLRSDLNMCKNELAVAKRQLDLLRSNSNRPALEKIKIEINFIQSNIIPKIQSRWLNLSPARIDQLKEELESKLNIIAMELGHVK